MKPENETITQGNMLGDVESRENDKKTKKISKTKIIIVCMSAIAVFFMFIILIPILYFLLDHSTYMALAKGLMICGIICFILGGMIVAISLAAKWAKRNKT